MLPVFLAAGLGRRLDGVPKALYSVGGCPLVLRAANTLRAVGFDRMLIVTGHRSEHVREYWHGLSIPPLHVEWLHNPRFSELNNFHTVALACEQSSDEALLLLNSDILFLPEVVTGLWERSEDVVVVVDDAKIDDEAMGVRVVGGRAVELGKHLASTEATGEFIGCSVMRGDGKRRYLNEHAKARASLATDLYYEDLFASMAASEPLGVALVAAESWAEIDAPEDLPRAVEVARRQDRLVPRLDGGS